jgi:lipopolysaccharide transport system ATP-binding protein
MYVRLAFAVAAHLEPDILIVDEVLAVGDSEFQKKSVGKMKDVSADKGRTIIFVSHNMQAVNALCEKAIWLQKGKVVADGDTQTVVNKYLSAYKQKLWKQEWSAGNAPGNEYVKMLSVELIPQLASTYDMVDIRTPITVRFKFENKKDGINLMTGIHLFTIAQECIFDVCTRPGFYDKGVLEGECVIPGNLLNDGSYYISIIFVRDTHDKLYYFEECLYFDVEDYREGMKWFGKWMGYVRPQLPFTLRPAGTFISTNQ